MQQGAAGQRCGSLVNVRERLASRPSLPTPHTLSPPLPQTGEVVAIKKITVGEKGEVRPAASAGAAGGGAGAPPARVVRGLAASWAAEQQPTPLSLPQPPTTPRA